jgi:rubrerythrin
MTKETLETIETLAENELLISLIYRAFSLTFPEHFEFWDKLAQEEVQHADMLRSLVPEVKEGTVRFKADRLDETSAGMFRDYLKYALDRAKKEDIHLKDAFETALAIEHDLIERSFFRLFEQDAPEVQLIFEGLASSTREHHRQLVEAVKKSGQSPQEEGKVRK